MIVLLAGGKPSTRDRDIRKAKNNCHERIKPHWDLALAAAARAEFQDIADSCRSADTDTGRANF